MKIKERAVSKLANAMRIYAEANLKFDALKLIDLEEAIDNLDSAFEAKLEAFHSLYDVDKDDFDYFANADTAVLILLRNAIHHRDHELFLSWNAEMRQDGGPRRFLGAEFLLASHRVVDAPWVSRQFYKAEDFLLRVDTALNSPALERRMGERSRSQMLRQINLDLCFDEILVEATAHRYPPKQVYVNIIPIFISATCRAFQSLKARGIAFNGFDAKAYELPFTDELKVDLTKISYDTIRIT